MTEDENQADDGQQAKNGGDTQPEPGDVPEATFAGFVSALAGQTLIHLGLAPNPATGKADLSANEAKYSIDLLQIIRDKTEGNLSDEEDRLISGVLYDLRMRYVNSMR